MKVSFKRYPIWLWLAVIGGLIIVMTWQLKQSLPSQLFAQNYSKVLFDQHHNLLAARIASDQQWRFPPVEQLPDKYVTALLVFEDKNFYQHFAVDLLAIARAAFLNLKNGHVVSGGSTITMQLARLLSDHPNRNFTAKLAELWLAFKLETQLTKQQILTEYTARAPYGGNIVGLNSASWRYFSHQLNDISWAEAALLAVLPNNPANLNLSRNRNLLINKRNKLLHRLAALNIMTPLDLKLALLEKLPLKPTPLPNVAPHLLDSLIVKYPTKNQFISYIELDVQQQLYQVLSQANRELVTHNINNLSGIVIDNHQQSVIAYIGNQTLSHNRVYAKDVDINQSARSSGSLFKPFLYAMQLQQGDFLRETLVADVPSFYQGYHPENYDRQYRGLVSAQQALTQSLNVPAVRALQQYGVSSFLADLKQLGLTTLWRDAEGYGLSLILGGAETNLYEITHLYSRLLLSAAGKVKGIKQAKLFTEQRVEYNELPIKRGAAWLTLDSLLQVNRPDGFNRNLHENDKIAWKTGTSYGWHDAWAVGTNGRYTVGIWAGNANGEEARLLSGTQTSAPLMFSMFRYLKNQQWPPLPEIALKQYQVCANDGYLAVNGCQTTKVLAPIESEFSQLSPYQQNVNLSSDGIYQVHGLCERPSQMQQQSYFVLPPVIAFYYRPYHSNWHQPPAWRSDCVAELNQLQHTPPFSIEYPQPGTRIKIPVELDGKLGRLVLKAIHQKDNATLFWQINNEFIGQTQGVHHISIVLDPGKYKLKVSDQQGAEIKTWFEVL